LFNRSSSDDAPVTATGGRNTPFSLIGGDVVVTGDIAATVDLHVDGRIDGDLACAGLVQGTDSVIHGAVTAKTARIAGTIEGSVTADELIVERGARIVGDVSYGTLTVAAGAVIDGQFRPKAAPGVELKVVSA
jgi:cytoskeletal protein CcmA (bactofilin family)